MNRPHTRWPGLVLVAACSFALAAGAARWATAHSPARTDETRATADTASARRELVMVYIGSSSCAASNRPELRDDVRGLRRELQALRRSC